MKPENSMTDSETKKIDGAVPMHSSSTSSPYLDRLANVRHRLPAAARQLKDAAVATVHIFYNGCGDSGQIETIEYTGADGKSIDIAGRVGITESDLLDLFYDLIEVRHAGWENNDGAFGEFDWDLATGSLKHSHSDRFTDYETTEHDGI
jgi:hypothetical protein